MLQRRIQANHAGLGECTGNDEHASNGVLGRAGKVSAPSSQRWDVIVVKVAGGCSASDGRARHTMGSRNVLSVAEKHSVAKALAHILCTSGSPAFVSPWGSPDLPLGDLSLRRSEGSTSTAPSSVSSAMCQQ
jgi:hypothetical protein